MITAQKIFNQKPVALIVGGGSFLGSFLAEALLLEGCRVIFLDVLTPRTQKNLEKCFQNKDFVFIEYQAGNIVPAEIKNQEIFYIFDLIGEENLSFQLWQLAEEKKAKILVVASKNFSWDVLPKNFPRLILEL